MAVYRDIDSDVRIGGSLTLPSGSLVIGATNVITALGTKVDTSRTISAGTGLTGGGSLSSNRTLSANFGTGAGTIAEGNHGHSFSSLSGKPTTLSGYGITDAAASSHTHPFSQITSRPTTLSGYGITDASLSNHNHDSSYLKLDGGTITGQLKVDDLLHPIFLSGANNNEINWYREDAPANAKRMTLGINDYGDLIIVNRTDGGTYVSYTIFFCKRWLYESIQ